MLAVMRKEDLSTGLWECFGEKLPILAGDIFHPSCSTTLPPCFIDNVDLPPFAVEDITLHPYSVVDQTLLPCSLDVIILCPCFVDVIALPPYSLEDIILPPCITGNVIPLSCYAEEIILHSCSVEYVTPCFTEGIPLPLCTASQPRHWHHSLSLLCFGCYCITIEHCLVSLYC